MRGFSLGEKVEECVCVGLEYIYIYISGVKLGRREKGRKRKRKDGRKMGVGSFSFPLGVLRCNVLGEWYKKISSSAGGIGAEKGGRAPDSVLARALTRL